MAIVNSCCCGCSLSTGTTITAILSTIESIFFLLCGILILNYEYTIGAVCNENDDNCQFSVTQKPQSNTGTHTATNTGTHTSSHNHKSPKNNYDGMDGYYTEQEIRNIGIWWVVESSIILLASIFLLWGVSSKRRALLLPWLISRGITLGIQFFGCIALLVMGKRYRETGANILFLIIMVYLYIIVVSYYQTRMEGSYTGGQIMIISTEASLAPFLHPPPQPPPGYRLQGFDSSPYNPPIGWIHQSYAMSAGTQLQHQSPPIYTSQQNNTSSAQSQDSYQYPFAQPLPPIANTTSNDNQR